MEIKLAKDKRSAAESSALDRMIFTKPIYEEPVYVMINKVHYAYAQPDQTDDPQDPPATVEYE